MLMNTAINNITYAVKTPCITLCLPFLALVPFLALIRQSIIHTCLSCLPDMSWTTTRLDV